MKRRDLIKNSLGLVGVSLGTAALAKAAEICGVTPAQTEGPFYPIKDQSDKDADLTSVRGRMQSALGEVIWVTGVVTDLACAPVKGVLVEIWQACESGKYNHPQDPNPAPLDPNFQYWGRSVTNEKGEYRFKTIIPGAYPADAGWVRPPHIHYKVSKLGYLELTTQMYFEGHALNAKDRILQRLSKSEQSKVIAPISVAADGLPVAKFDISIEKA